MIVQIITMTSPRNTIRETDQLRRRFSESFFVGFVLYFLRLSQKAFRKHSLLLFPSGFQSFFEAFGVSGLLRAILLQVVS